MMQEFNKDLIASCGMNCMICIGYFGYTMSGEKRKTACIGCTPRDKSCAFLKKYCEKLRKKEINYCFECNDFPCKQLKKLDEHYQKKYDMSMVENLIFIKKNGSKKFFELQKEKYECPVCKGTICVHTKICYNCK